MRKVVFAIVALSLLGIFSTSFQSQAAEESLLQVERKGLEYVRSLAEQGNADAQFLMGWKYYWGDGVLANGMQSAEWFQKSSRQNNALAKSMMGILFWNWISEDGTKEELDQVNRLVKESIESLREQAEQGNTYAQCILGELFYLGLHVPKDYVQSAEWYRKAAEQGNAIGSLNMGDLYAEGSGVPKDYTQAAEWYRKAVEQGSVIGNNRMGGLYEEGNGVPQDYAQAAEWYRKAAEQGDVAGNFNMGDLYAEGNGVPQDYAQAAEWYRKAAEQGNTYAQFKLGHMYGMGQGVEQSAEKHYFWVYIPAVLSDATKKEIEEIYPLFVLFGLSKKDFGRIEKDADDLIQKKGWKSNKEWERNIRNLIGH